MSKKHSLIGPSSAKRVIECPGSVGLHIDFLKQMTAQLGRPPARKSSKYSAEGTLAHRIAEDILNGKPVPKVGDEIEEEGFTFKLDEDFLRDVQVYVDYVEGLRVLGYNVELENEVDISHLWGNAPPPEKPFGTADCIAYNVSTGEMLVADLKFGRGVAVSAINNAQLRYYALGACYKLGIRPTTLHLVIVQPRAENPEGRIRGETITFSELWGWATNVLKPAVDSAFTQTPARKMGDHCQFCPAQSVCPEKRQLALDTARHIFANTPTELTPKPDTQDLIKKYLDSQQLGALLTALDDLKSWADEVQAHAHAYVETGGKADGWKLADKQARRKWTDETQVREVLSRMDDLSVQEFLDMDLKSPAQILKNPKIKSNQFVSNLLGGLVVAQSSGTTLVPVTDPRPSVQGKPTAREVFSKPAEL